MRSTFPAGRRTRSRSAFTLLELIVVLVVLAVLSAIAVPTFGTLVSRSEERAVKVTLEAVRRDAAATARVDGNQLDTPQFAEASEELPGMAAGEGLHAAAWATTVVLNDTPVAAEVATEGVIYIWVDTPGAPTVGVLAALAPSGRVIYVTGALGVAAASSVSGRVSEFDVVIDGSGDLDLSPLADTTANPGDGGGGGTTTSTTDPNPLEVDCATGSPDTPPGTVVAWGGAQYGGIADSPGPGGLSNVRDFAASNYGAAIDADGRPFQWGPTSASHIYSPWQAYIPPWADEYDFFAIDATTNGTVALHDEGQFTQWGDRTLSAPAGLNTWYGPFADVAAGGDYTLLLACDGTVFGWGSPYGSAWANAIGGAGHADVVAIEGGHYSAMTLHADGTVREWGTSACWSTPSGLPRIEQIAAGDGFAMALDEDGTVHAWGNPALCGAGESGVLSIPATALSGVVDIAAGANFAMALKADGTVITWGASGPYQNDGQLDVPAAIQGHVVDIEAGLSSGLAIVSD